MAKLTEHFDSKEFDCNDGTKVPERYHGQLEKLCEWFLEPMRAKFGACRVLSGYRTDAYNARIGGALYSFHVYTDRMPRDGVAADVCFAKGTPKEWGEFARRMREKHRDGQGGVGVYVHNGFVHVDTRDYEADWVG